MTRKEIKSLAKQQINGKIGILFVISLIIYLITIAVNSVPGVGQLASTFVITPAFTFAMTAIYLNIASSDDYRPKVGDAFSKFDSFWLAFKITFLTGLFTFLWSLLFVIPGIVKALSYSQAMRIAVENPGIGAREAIKKSQEMMNGHKMDLFILGLSFVGWIILGMFTFGILYIWLIPYMNAAMTVFYNNINPRTAQTEFESAEFVEFEQ